MNIIRAATATLPPRILIYGSEGVGKTTLAAKFPGPIFLQTEDGCPSGLTIDTFGVPATPEIVRSLQTARWGEKTIWEILVAAGVQMTENAGCAACLGGPVDTFGGMNAPMKCISATNQNFPGRMGHKESQVFLASPATVAASALAGRIADPREFLS